VPNTVCLSGLNAIAVADQLIPSANSAWSWSGSTNISSIIGEAGKIGQAN
jgi:hypothetical protein